MRAYSVNITATVRLKAAVHHTLSMSIICCCCFRAANFDPEELPEVMQYLHARGVKGYVTVNILVFDRELARLEQRIRQIAQAGVDAVIVQVGAAGVWAQATFCACGSALSNGRKHMLNCSCGSVGVGCNSRLPC